MSASGHPISCAGPARGLLARLNREQCAAGGFPSAQEFVAGVNRD